MYVSSESQICHELLGQWCKLFIFYCVEAQQSITMNVCCILASYHISTLFVCNTINLVLILYVYNLLFWIRLSLSSLTM